MKFKDLETPCFIVDYETYVSDITSIKKVLKDYWGNFLVGYSFKTNNIPAVISVAKEMGLSAEVVSDDEYQLALLLGFEHSQIIFNGPVKSKSAFLSAISNGCYVNIDSKRELSWLLELNKPDLKDSRIGLRVNFCIEDYCPNESQCGLEDGRFGFSLERGELFDSINFFKRNSIPLSGLHIHCSSKTRSVGIYKAIANKACEIINEYQLDLKYIDIGGGFYGPMPKMPSFQEYFEAVSEVFNSNGVSKKICLIIEPGMSVIGRNISYLTTIIDCKKTKNNCFAIVDGSRIHVDPFLRKNNYFYSLIQKSNIAKNKSEETIICGSTCMENDRFFSLNESVNTGDQILFNRVGAYTASLTPLFIQFYPAVYVKKGENYLIGREKMTAKDFLEIGKKDKKGNEE